MPRRVNGIVKSLNVLKNLPLLGVSACLLGHQVRYDGQHKYNFFIAEELKKHCKLIAVCPEVEIGLGVPRPKIQLTQIGLANRVLKTSEPDVDLSNDLIAYAAKFINQYALSGMVLQDKSPSCGIANTKLFSQAGEQIGVGSGLFAAKIIALLPSLVVVQASQLQSKDDIEWFVDRLLQNH